MNWKRCRKFNGTATKNKAKTNKKQQQKLSFKSIIKWYKDDLFYYISAFLHTPDTYAKEKSYTLLPSRKLYVLKSRKITHLFNVFSSPLKYGNILGMLSGLLQCE